MSSIIETLKRTKKGQLKYDSHWKEEGRTQEIVSSIKQNLSTLNLPSIKTFTLTENELPPKHHCLEENFNVNGTDNHHDGTNNLDQLLNDLIEENRKLESDSNFTITDLKLRNYEQQKMLEVLQKLEERQHEWNKKNEAMIKKYEDQMKIIEKKYLLKMMRWRKKYEEDFCQLDLELEKLRQQHSQNNENLSGVDVTSKNHSLKLKEIEEKHKLLLKQEERKRKQQMEFKQKICNCRDEINMIIQQCEIYPNDLLSLNINIREEFNNYRSVLQGLNQDLEVLLLSKKEFTPEDVHLSESKMRESYEMKQNFLAGLLQMKETNLLSQQPNALKTDSATLLSSTVNDITESIDHKPDANGPNSNDETMKIADCRRAIEKSMKSTREIYIEHQSKLTKFEKLCQRFYKDESKKQLRTSLQLYVRSIINTICNISVEHLREKILKLLHLFEKKFFEHKENKIPIGENDYSYHYAINVAVKMILTVMIKHRNISLKLAPVVVILWANVSMFGDIFLSHLYINCPYAIPYFPVKNSDQSNLEYMKMCGYQTNKNGNLESEESFHSRMFSLIELYSSIIQCNMPAEDHPQNIHCAWRWLALILNNQPHDGITALLLDSFLSMSSHKLYAIYAKQFVKLVHYIQSNFIVRIEAVTSKENRQTLMKFKSLMRDVEKKLTSQKPLKMIVEDLSPDGLVPNYFFTKSYIFMTKK